MSLITLIRSVFSITQKENLVTRHVLLVGPDGNFRIPEPPSVQNDRHLQPIHLPGWIKGTSPILFFNAHNSGPLRFTVRINNEIILNKTLAEATARSWHQAIPPNVMDEQQNNMTVAIYPTPETGTQGVQMEFSGILIVYSSNKIVHERPLVASPD